MARTLDRMALVLLDFQDSVVFGVPAAGIPGLPDADILLARVRSTLDAARSAGLMVVHVRVAFRAGHPEITELNRQFAPVRQHQAMLEGSPEAAFAAATSPSEGEVVVTKLRVGPFRGTDLELILRSRGIEHLAVAGLHTSGAVLSTVRQAADLDFGISVLSDGCADADAELHRVLVERIFPTQADVETCEAFVAFLQSKSA